MPQLVYRLVQWIDRMQVILDLLLIMEVTMSESYTAMGFNVVTQEQTQACVTLCQQTF